MQEQIKKQILELVDEKYRDFHKGLCPGTNNILGVRIPVLRNLAKEIAKGNWKEYLESARNEYYEEIMLQGMVIGLAKMSFEERLNYISNYIPKIDNWAVCDTFCAGLKDINKNLETMWSFIQKYLITTKEFELRFVVVIMLDYFIKEEYIDKVLNELDLIKHDGYYVKMAVAWAISVCYVKFPRKNI